MNKGRSQPEESRTVEELVRRRLGISSDRTNRSAISSAVAHRMRNCQVATTLEYLDRLDRDTDELQHLIDEIVVPETWFFRDRLPYIWLREHARRAPTETMRILSVPCASGEEAYSIAMVLLEQGLPPSAFHVDGIDVSRRAIDLAKAARYDERSFREPDFQDQQARWFHRSGGKYVLAPAVQAVVSFARGNLLEADFLAGQAAYDLIFCRNLLIYFDKPARRQALANLRRLLAPGGMLYVGHVEAGAFAEGPFRRAEGANPFVFVPARETPPPRSSFRKATERGDDRPEDRGSGRPAASSSRRTNATSSAFSPVPRRPSTPAPEPVTICDRHERDRCVLRTAAEAADAGRLEEAQSVCEAMLRDCPTCAEAFYLLGVVHDARGRQREAEECFHKAVYLDPTHHAALIHLGLHAQRRGELDAAANFRRRADNLMKEKRFDGR